MFNDHKCLDIKIPGAPLVFLIGDSHSASLSLGLKPLIDKNNLNLLQVSTGWCQPTNTDKNNTICQEIIKAVNNRIDEAKPDLLIIDAWWVAAMQPTNFTVGGDFYSYLAKKTQEYLDLGAKKVIVVGQIPTWKQSLPRQLADHFLHKDLPVPDRTFLGISYESLAMDRKMRDIDWPDRVTYISIADRLCNESGCLVKIGDNVDTDLIVWDYGHLTPKGSTFVVNELLSRYISSLQ